MYTGSGRTTWWKGLYSKESVGEDIIKIEGVDWFHLARDTNKWPVLQNAAMGPRFPQIKGEYLTR